MTPEPKENEITLTVVWTHGFSHEYTIQKRRLQVELKRLYDLPYVKHVKDGRKILKYEEKSYKI